MAKKGCYSGNNCGSNKLFYTQPFAGEPVPPEPDPTCGVTYDSPFLVFTPDGGTVVIDMTFLTEVLVISHVLMRRGENDNNYSQVGDPIPYDSNADGQYSIIDETPIPGFTLYKIVTTLTDCVDVESEPQSYIS